MHPQVTSEETVRRSLGIANAVELVKLVLLNAASAEVPFEVVDALRRCEESHVFAAFSYLRYQDYVVSCFSSFGDIGTRGFVDSGSMCVHLWFFSIPMKGFVPCQMF